MSAQGEDTTETQEDAIKQLEKQDVIHQTLLACVQDDTNLFYKLRGTPHIVEKIWHLYRGPYYWKSLIKLPKPATRPEKKDGIFNPNDLEQEYGFMLPMRSVIFPPPKDININMMPFIYSKNFKDTKLPEYLKDYFYNMIFPFDPYLNSPPYQELEGKVCYLTIHESFVEENNSQRRPGLHTENPGTLRLPAPTKTNKGPGQSKLIWYEHHWGNGMMMTRKRMKGGIYMVSNVPDSCAAWNCKIMSDANGHEIINRLGDIEHLRDLLPKPTMMRDNTMYWITDRTPHESLPLNEGKHRQWFRLVTDQVSLWFEDHSTKNPNGVVPDPKMTKIVKGSKFDNSSLHIVPPS